MNRAKYDMREIHRYISDELQNPIAADSRISLIESKIRTLKKNPTRAPLARDYYLASKSFRVLVVKTQLVLYIVREKTNTVSIMRVLYGRRDWMNLLKADLDAENI
jgi:plasmid stabilization system protein ParE